MPSTEEENDVDGIIMMKMVLDELKGDFSRLNEGSNNGMLEEALDALKCKDESRNIENCTVGFLLNHMSAKEGIKTHDDIEEQSLLKEFSQLHDKDAFRTIAYNKLMHVQKRKSSHAISTMKEIRDDSLKGRACSNEKKQKE